MKDTSLQYKADMSQNVRNQSYVNIIFRNIDPEAAFDGYWQASDAADYSELSTLDYEFDYGPAMATLELNRMILGDNFQFFPDPGQPLNEGFVSDSMTNGNSESFTPINLTRQFSKQRTFPGLTIKFDTRLHEWPREVTAQYFRNEVLVNSATVTVTNDTVTIALRADKIDKVRLTFTMDQAYRRVRVEQIDFGVTKVFHNKDIETLVQKHDVDPLSRRLPQESFSFTLLDYNKDYDFDNPRGEWKFMDEHAPVAVQFGYELNDGSIEYLRPDRYILNGKPKFSNSRATFTAVGVLNSLNGKFYKSKVGTKNLYNMAVEVLQDARLMPSTQGTDPWDISVALKTIETTSVLPIATHAECLQMIAYAARCKLYTDDRNIFHIEPFDPKNIASSGFVVDNSTIMDKSQNASKIAQLKNLEIEYYTAKRGEANTELYKISTGATKLHCEFAPATDIKINVSGGQLLESFVFAQAADLTLSEGTKSIVITGTPLEFVKSSYTQDVAPEGEPMLVSNPLISTEEEAKKLASHIASYLQLRNTYDVRYRGNPELEVGDIIALQTTYNTGLNALVLVDEIKFNGALHGTLKVKSLQREEAAKSV